MVNQSEFKVGLYAALFAMSIVGLSWGSVSFAEPEPSSQNVKSDSGDTHNPGNSPDGKRQGQSPALKSRHSGDGHGAPQGKRTGQSPALKHNPQTDTSHEAPIGKRQGQSPKMK